MARTPITVDDLVYAVVDLESYANDQLSSDQQLGRERMITWLKEEIAAREVSAIIDKLVRENQLTRPEARSHARALHKSGYRA